MISWYSILLLVISVLLTILVIRVSETSTRIQTLEQVAHHLAEDHTIMFDTLENTVTHKELRTILRCAPSYFSTGSPVPIPGTSEKDPKKTL